MYELSVYEFILEVSTYQPVVADYWRFVVLETQSCSHCLLDCLETLGSPDVYCLAHVPTLRKTCVVSPEKSQNVFLRSLIRFVDLYSLSYQLSRINHKSNAVQKFPLPSFLQNISVKSLLITFRNDIPSLNRTLVTVVKRIKPHIFDMPAKSRKHHAHVDPRNSNPTNFLVVFLRNLQNRTIRLVHIVEVELRLCIIEVLISCLDTLVQWKTRTVLVNRKISSVLDCHFIFLGCLRIISGNTLDQFPVLVFKLGFFGTTFPGKFEFIIFLKFFGHVGEGPDIVLLIFLVESLNNKKDVIIKVFLSENQIKISYLALR